MTLTCCLSVFAALPLCCWIAQNAFFIYCCKEDTQEKCIEETWDCLSWNDDQSDTKSAFLLFASLLHDKIPGNMHMKTDWVVIHLKWKIVVILSSLRLKNPRLDVHRFYAKSLTKTWEMLINKCRWSSHSILHFISKKSVFKTSLLFLK